MSDGGLQPECAFCAIARGTDDDAEIVCEASTWVAFFPLEPAAPGHTLVIPRAHAADLWHVEQPAAHDLMVAVQRVGRAIETALQPDGMNLITSAGSAAEQTVFHAHFHLVPRWREDGFGQIWPTGGRYDVLALDPVAARIREACKVGH